MSEAATQWREPGGSGAAAAILAFFESVGIPVAYGAIAGSTLLPGMALAAGALQIDPAVAACPGDLLHEAGHYAVMTPEARAAQAAVTDDPGEEMAAIAWSVAAAKACGVALNVLFHDDGYKGGPTAMREAFAADKAPLGVPLLAWYGMTAEPHRTAEVGIPAFPAMQRWLR